MAIEGDVPFTKAIVAFARTYGFVGSSITGKVATCVAVVPVANVPDTVYVPPDVADCSMVYTTVNESGVPAVEPVITHAKASMPPSLFGSISTPVPVMVAVASCGFIS